VRLSIFNSDTSWPIRVLVKTCLIVSIWNTILLVIPPKITAGTNQRNDNVVRFEQYVFNPPDNALLIAGSSLAARLRASYFQSPEICNLSAGGGSALSILSVIAGMENNYPSAVLIEASHILLERGIDYVQTKKLTDLYNSSRQFLPKKAFPMLRASYQPSVIFLNMLMRFRHDEPQPEDKEGMIVKDGAGVELANTVMRNILLQNLREKDFSAAQEQNAELLGKILQVIQSKGIQVIFFIMPVHSEIENTEACRNALKLLYEKFPETQYKWISHKNHAEFKTTDGVHLSALSARSYTKFLEHKLINALQRKCNR